jgi:hypothetical protein
MKPKQRARFLNFNFQTSQVNSGTQNYGAGNSSKGRSVAQARNVNFGPVSMGDSFGSRRKERQVQMVNTGDSITQAHRELVGDVVSSQSFAATQYRIQPADATTFPWLSTLATKYQKWRVRKLVVKYVPTVGEFAPAGQQGRVVLAVNYDSYDAVLQSIQQAENIRPNTPGLPTEFIEVKGEPAMLTPLPLQVRNGLVQTGQALSAYDAGVIYVATDGAATAVTDGTKLGELFIEYVIDFYEPILVSMVKVPPPTHSTRIYSMFTVTTTIPIDGNWYSLPDLQVDLDWNGCGLTVQGNRLRMQPGRYLITAVSYMDTASGVSRWSSRFVNGAAPIIGTAITERLPTGTTATSANIDWRAVIHLEEEGDIGPQLLGTGTGNFAEAGSEYWPVFLCQTI